VKKNKNNYVFHTINQFCHFSSSNNRNQDFIFAHCFVNGWATVHCWKLSFAIPSLKSDKADMLLRTKLHIKRSCSKRKSFWLQIQQQFS